MKSKWLFILGVAILSLCLPRTSYAIAIFDITVDTSGLGAPSTFFFQLNDGSGTNDANNTVTIEQLMFGGGPSGAPELAGGASVDPLGLITLTDSEFFNSFSQTFTPGSALSFRLTTTTFVDAGETPDAFAFGIIGPDGNPLGTDEIGGTLLTLFITSTDPKPDLYGANVVPEPGTLTLLGLGMAGAMGRRYYRSLRSRVQNQPNS